MTLKLELPARGQRCFSSLEYVGTNVGPKYSVNSVNSHKLSWSQYTQALPKTRAGRDRDTCSTSCSINHFLCLLWKTKHTPFLLQEDCQLLFQEKSVAMSWLTNVMANCHGKTCFCPVSSWQEKDSLLGKALLQPSNQKRRQLKAIPCFGR